MAVRASRRVVGIVLAILLVMAHLGFGVAPNRALETVADCGAIPTLSHLASEEPGRDMPVEHQSAFHLCPHTLCGPWMACLQDLPAAPGRSGQWLASESRQPAGTAAGPTDPPPRS